MDSFYYEGRWVIRWFATTSIARLTMVHRGFLSSTEQGEITQMPPQAGASGQIGLNR